MENTARKLFIIGILFFLIFAFLFIANDTAFADTEISYLEYNTSTNEFETQQYLLIHRLNRQQISRLVAHLFWMMMLN